MDTCVTFKLHAPPQEPAGLTSTKSYYFWSDVSQALLKELKTRAEAIGLVATRVKPGSGCGAVCLIGPKNARISALLDLQPSPKGPYLCGTIACWEAPSFWKSIFKKRSGEPTEEEAHTLTKVAKEVAAYLKTKPSVEICKWMTVQEWCHRSGEE